MNEVLILDVGHGNSAIVRHDGETVVIDAPLREHLVDALRMEGIARVRLAVASHSDSDHCGGFIGLLLDPEIVVDELRMNADATRQTKTVQRKFWKDLKVAWKRAFEMHGTRLRVELTDQIASELNAGSLNLEVLYPPAELAVGGVGSTADDARVVTPNAMSAVVRVVLDGVPLVLLTGDLDAAGLAYLLRTERDLTAKVLVFPHHGGLPEGAATGEAVGEFATSLLRACHPEAVLFSIGRGLHATPRPEIMRAIRASGFDVYVACTQLSQRCSDEIMESASHLAPRYAAGRADGRCCLGTAVLRADEGLIAGLREKHETAVALLPSRLCR